MSLPIQADAIRVALLNKYGGIWMDADTIITNGEFLNNLEKYELSMFGRNNSQHIGFIFASQNSIIIREWLREIIHRVKSYRKFKNRILKVPWDYLGNSIIDNLINSNISNKFIRLDKDKMNVFPELEFFRNTSLNTLERYRLFYFKKRDPKIVLNNTKGIILLHNSWTPSKYKKLPEIEVLKEDNLVSRLLSHIINIAL